MSVNVKEKLLKLLAAIEAATGQRPHPATVYRWHTRGIKGVRLVTVRLGGKRLCSVEAVLRFVQESTAAADGPQPGTIARTSRRRAAAIAQAESELDSLGI